MNIYLSIPLSFLPSFFLSTILSLPPFLQKRGGTQKAATEGTLVLTRAQNSQTAGNAMVQTALEQSALEAPSLE